MSYDTATPYIAAFVILRRNGKVAFVLREHTSWMNDHYGLPSGKVEKNESYTAAAVREAKEEVGVTLTAADLHFVCTMHRYNPEDSTSWVDVFFRSQQMGR